MEQTTAQDALEYVAGREVLLLVGVILGGGLLHTLGSAWMVPDTFHSADLIVRNALASLLVVAGTLTSLGGSLALFYKIVRDATA